MTNEWDENVQLYIQSILHPITSISSHKTLTISNGFTFTNLGPSSYQGNILDTNDVWMEDILDDQRIQEAKEYLKRKHGLSHVNQSNTFWLNKYSNESNKYWNEFYKRNHTNFYKDRHYLHIIFPELLQANIHLLEIGCGVGNAIIPLLYENHNLIAKAFDISSIAIDLLNHSLQVLNNKQISNRIHTFVYNLLNTSNTILEQQYLQDNTYDYILCFFVLSSISPNNLIDILKRVFDLLKPNGKLLIRDYGRYDEAQLRFSKNAKLQENFYVRQDGTLVYYFDINELNTLCQNIQYNDYQIVVDESKYITRQYSNRKQQNIRRRIWIHAKYQKQMKNAL